MRTNTISLLLPPGGGGGAGVGVPGRLGDERWLDADVCTLCLKAKWRHCPDGSKPVSQQPLSAGAVRQNEFRPLAPSQAAAAPSDRLGSLLRKTQRAEIGLWLRHHRKQQQQQQQLIQITWNSFGVMSRKWLLLPSPSTGLCKMEQIMCLFPSGRRC